MHIAQLDQGLARIAPLALPVPDASLWTFDRPFVKNIFPYDATTILAQLLRRDPTGRSWHLGTMYIEFENNSGAAVTPPSPSREEGLDYYNSLADHPQRDYLRVPMITTILESSDEDLYPDGNVARFLAHTAGDEGVHGKEFSSSQQSRVYGTALVASPSSSDASADKIFSRAYYSSTSDQHVKTASTQIAVEHRLPFI